MKLCVNCRHIRQRYHDGFDGGHLCGRTATERSLVDGGPIQTYVGFCADERRNEAGCGVSARYFEPRNGEVR